MTYIIAEAGVNHNGSLKLAKELAVVAKYAGADAVKYQTFIVEELVTRDAKQAYYQVENLGEETTQYNMLKKLALSYEEFRELHRYCKGIEIEFLSTPFEFKSLHFLVEDLQVRKLKIPSGELTNYPLIHKMATYRLPLLISTGMATLTDIHEALSFVAYGLAFPKQVVRKKEVADFYQTEQAWTILKKYVTLLHCTSAYPTPPEAVNLRAMSTMEKEFQLPIGLSDHTESSVAAISAVARNAQVIEKHFTLSKELEGPDHKASLEPQALIHFIQQLRETECILGLEEKAPIELETSTQAVARKSLVARQPIKKGEWFTEENVTVKRPAGGRSPKDYWDVLQTVAKKSYERDEFIE